MNLTNEKENRQDGNILAADSKQEMYSKFKDIGLLFTELIDERRILEEHVQAILAKIGM